MAATATKGASARILADGTVLIHGVIGDEFDGLDSATLVEEIHDIVADEFVASINSPGGAVTDGLAIYHELLTHPANVIVEITGVAASMASVIAMAGSVVRIAENGIMMVHNPWNVAVGDADDLRKAAEMLDKFGDSLVDIYVRKTGLDEAEIRSMMNEETWLNAEEALEKGFVDEIIAPVEAEAFAELDVSELTKVPVGLINLIREGRKMARARAQTDDKPTGQAEDPKGAPPAADPPTEPTEPKESEVSGQVTAAMRDFQNRERERRKGIQALVQKAGLEASFATELFDDGVTVDEAGPRIIDALAKRQDEGDGPSWVPSGVESGPDARDKWLEGMANWLIVKSGQAGMIEAHTGERPDPGEFRGLRLLDIARDALEMRGQRVRGLSPHEITRLALIGGPRAENAGLGTRSDFPILLENVLHKMLLAAYETAPDQWRSIATIGSVSDFREHRRYRTGSLPALDDLLESGEFKQMHFPDAEKEAIQAGTKGNVIGLTRQAIINDDMDGFARLVQMLGRAAARSIEIDVFALLAENSGLGPTMQDGNTLFHADHNNLETSEEGPPDIDAFEAARVLMAKQKDPSDNDFLNLRPAVWTGPIGLGAAARTAIGAEFDFSAETSGNTSQFRKPNVVRDMLDTIVDTPRLTGTRWYLFADPSVAPVLEVAFLDGQESPEIQVEEGFDYDGIRWRVRHDWGAGAIDFRGAVTNDGAA